MTTEYKNIRENLVQSLGQLSEDAGFGRSFGQIYGLLYLSPEKLSLGEVAENLGVTKGNISLNVHTLERWGLIRRFNKTSDRRDYYEVETDFWKIIRGILRDREKQKIGDLKKTLADGLKEVDKSGSGEAEFYEERLKHMIGFIDAFNRMLNAYLTLEKFRFTTLGRIGKENAGDDDNE
jgi:DNA-binding transcriptional regulator GbsR (MarR family)